MGNTMNRTRSSRFVSMSAVAAAALVAATGMTQVWAAPPDALVAAAKQEGQLTVIALPHDWCGYGAMISAFQAKYGIKINELNRMPARATRSKPSRPTRATRDRRRRT